MQKDLRYCLELYKSSDLLLEVSKETDPETQIAAVMKGAEKMGKAVHFLRAGNTDFTVVNNVFGSRRMLALLFETEPEKVVNEWIDRIKHPIQPETVPGGPVKEVIKKGSEVNLQELPQVVHSSKDAGAFITGGLVIAKDPETGTRNVSINRMQFKGRNKLGIRMMPPQHLGIIHEKSERLGRNLEVAVAIGNHPFETLCAATTVAYGQDEFSLSSGLRREPLQTVNCETVDLEVPSTAEIVLEGEVIAGVRESEGPFGDFMQYYVPVMENHVLEVHAVTHRKNPIYQVIQASSLEDVHLLGLSRESKVFEAVSKVADIVAVALVPTILGCMISIRKRFEGEPKNVAAAAFGAYSWLKYCVVVDQDVDVFDVNDVWWAMCTRSRPDRGVFGLSEALGFPRDPFHIHQSKLGIDATAPLNQWDEFERKVVPGANTVKPQDFF
jgi:2,5-furandicarboxylate decarboxylase 1